MLFLVTCLSSNDGSQNPQPNYRTHNMSLVSNIYSKLKSLKSVYFLLSCSRYNTFSKQWETMGTKCDTGGGVEGGDTKPKKKNNK